MKNQSQIELSVFKNFVSASGLPILAKSIEKRDPPEPDILCEIVGDGLVAFELVELLESDFAESKNLFINTEVSLRKYYKNLPENDKAKFINKYNNATLYYSFYEKLNLRKRDKLFGQIFDHLLKLDDGFIGRNLNDKSIKGLKYIKIKRGNYNGPSFQVEHSGTFSNPIIEIIKKKTKKNYITNHTIELIVYIDQGCMLSDYDYNCYFNELNTLIENSHFRRIWIHDNNRIQILYKFPE